MDNTSEQYYLNILLSTIDQRIILIEDECKTSSEKKIAYKTLLEQISKQHKKLNYEKRSPKLFSINTI